MAKALNPIAIGSKKTTTTHPRTGSQFNIDAAIYEPFKAAILQSLKGSKGKTFTELTDDVVKIIKKKCRVLQNLFHGTQSLSGWIWKHGVLLKRILKREEN